MALHDHKVKSVLKESGTVVESAARGFKMIADEPKYLGGTNTGMTPVETLLCAIGACQCLSARFFAAWLKINMEAFSVDVEGSSDVEGFLKGDSGIRPGLQEIRVTYHIKSNAPQEKITELLSLVEERCIVGETVLNGTPIVVRHIVENQ